MLLAFGIACALFESERSGKGQVIDAAMVDGAAILMAAFYGLRADGKWTDRRGTNMLDGGAHFYDAYETADGKWVSVGSIEPQFYELLLKHAGIDDADFKNRMDPRNWPRLKAKMAEVFKTKTREDWCRIMENTDVCFAPVLTFEEAVNHPHNAARGTFVEVEGVPQPFPAPRFSRTRAKIQGPPPAPGEHTEAVLEEWGLSAHEIETLRAADAIG
jgi:alpha-methylacyl-CoA racemase